MYEDLGPLEYELAITSRTSYLDDSVPEGYFGAVDYVGDYCVVAGYNPPVTSVRGNFCVTVYRVGHLSLMEALEVPVPCRMILAQYGADRAAQVREVYMFAKESFAGLQDIVTEG